jgi:endonuclease YncB( thermonuclease family)
MAAVFFHAPQCGGIMRVVCAVATFKADALTRCEIFCGKMTGSINSGLSRAEDYAIKVVVNFCFCKVPVILMRFLVVVLLFFATSPAWADDAVVRDGDTIQVAGVTYKLNGIDAPEFDQMCTDEHAEPWACGVEARDHLASLIDKHGVHCEDLGPIKTYAKWHSGVCTIDGETISLNQSLVRQGYALNFEPDAPGKFKEDEAGARDNRSGLWKGCFVAPQEFRHWNKTAVLLGSACPSDKDRELRESLFPEELAMPPGCAIKAKLTIRAHVTGNVGVYHIQACRSYAPVTKPNRWFCSEEDAQAAGFRKAYNCRPILHRK